MAAERTEREERTEQRLREESQPVLILVSQVPGRDAEIELLVGPERIPTGITAPTRKEAVEVLAHDLGLLARAGGHGPADSGGGSGEEER